MASPYSQILAEMNGRVQENAQAGVPLTPANGNPAGAHNMAGANQPVQLPAKQMLASPFLQYSAANPSPFMQGITAMLAGPQVTGAPVIPAAIPLPTQQQLPVLPIRARV